MKKVLKGANPWCLLLLCFVGFGSVNPGSLAVVDVKSNGDFGGFVLGRGGGGPSAALVLTCSFMNSGRSLNHGPNRFLFSCRVCALDFFSLA